MKAVRFASYGGPEVLVQEEVPLPDPGPGEVLLRVHAAGVNPIDWKVRAGHLKESLRSQLPLIPGWDVSGVVEKVGIGMVGVTEGEEVYGMMNFSRDGAYAEYAVAAAEDLAPKPSSLDHVHAAAVPLAALTAWQGLFDVADLRPGQSVLIHGAAGGVGHFAVQFAKWKGAWVIGTSSSRNINVVGELGADELIDYEKAAFDEVLSDVDVVLDTQGGEIQRRSWPVIRTGGTLVSTVSLSVSNSAAERGVRGELMLVRPDANELAQIAALIDSGDVRPLVSNIIPLAEAARAQQLSQTGHVRGKIVLRVRE
ncbi:NADP-dependent oxidoreductase [Geomonas sp. RF6]|uniref:NADP-dependent oxidoreductase n=1 Tax=Geomonas sp. RF6 TaxID=2897342 RepID=UPI001E4E0AB6|nr:NADP-dependent oxidoreductase [Geomonas sp. RF6]UFS72515.1 NADP-dependent oxidoreductase [Geomonas sp. RF6]